MSKLTKFVSTHSRPKAAGCRCGQRGAIRGRFQLTAARRRLARKPAQPQPKRRFNSQPPEGGWAMAAATAGGASRFNSQPPEGGWA